MLKVFEQLGGRTLMSHEVPVDIWVDTFGFTLNPSWAADNGRCSQFIGFDFRGHCSGTYV